jgi:bacterioferritin
MPLTEESVMDDLDTVELHKVLNTIMEYELAGVVRYTHYALMVRGPNRIPIVDFFKAQATESLEHAQQAGEILTGLEGHPTVDIAPIKETHKHSIGALLRESLEHEMAAVAVYKQLLTVVADRSIYLEEYARGQIGLEELHTMEINKMLRDYES